MSELKLTSVNTIISSDGSLKELIVDDFFDILNKKHGSDYAIYFEKDNNRFKVIFNGVEYYLTLDKITIENYIIGKDNNFTSKLRSIVNKTEKMEKRLADEEEQKALIALEKEKYEEEIDRRRKIIEDAEQGIMPGSDEDKRIYLDYLLDEKRLSNRIKRYFKNLGSDIITSFKVIHTKEICNSDDVGLNIIDIIIALIVALFSILCIICFWKCSLIIVKDILNYIYQVLTEFNFDFVSTIDKDVFSLLKYSLLPLKIYPIVLCVTTISVIKKRVSRLLHYRENKKLRNYKINELTYQLSLSNVKDDAIESFDKTLREEEKVEHIIVMDDYVMKYLGELAVRLKYINTDDSGKLLSEVEQLAVEYKQRIENVKTKELNEEHTSINLEIAPETERSIKVDILVRAGHICDKMLQIRGYDVEKMKLDEDFNILINMINEPAKRVVSGERLRCRKPTDNINKNDG